MIDEETLVSNILVLSPEEREFIPLIVKSLNLEINYN